MLLVLGLGALLHAAAARAEGERRTALVIGNANYTEAPLRNPVNDARAMAAKLRELGFTVIARENLKKREMEQAIGDFGTEISKGGVGLFYFAGHGLQVRGRNFLVPIDARISGEATVLVEGVDSDTVLEQMAAAGNGMNIVILDACRNNPFERRFRGGAQGLAQTDAPEGTIVAFATAPGKVASDGDGKNGLYTAELLAAMDKPGLKIEDVFKRVRLRVSTATAKSQIPWESSSLVGDFYFRGAPVATPSDGRSPEQDRVEDLAFWNSVKDSGRTSDYQAYLAAFPNGLFAPLARSRIADAEKAPDPAPLAAAESAAREPGKQAVAALPEEPVEQDAGTVPESSGTWTAEQGSWKLTARVDGRKLRIAASCPANNTRMVFNGRLGQDGQVLIQIYHKNEPVSLSGKFPALTLRSSLPTSCTMPQKFLLARQG